VPLVGKLIAVCSIRRTVSARSSGVAQSYATLGSGVHTSTTIRSAPSWASRNASARPWPRSSSYQRDLTRDPIAHRHDHLLPPVPGRAPI
jgi:hypothetical protein